MRTTRMIFPAVLSVICFIGTEGQTTTTRYPHTTTTRYPYTTTTRYPHTTTARYPYTTTTRYPYTTTTTRYPHTTTTRYPYTTTTRYPYTTTTRYPHTTTTRYPHTTTTRYPYTTTTRYPYTTTTRYPYTTTTRYPYTTTTRYPTTTTASWQTTTTSSHPEEGCPQGWVNSLEGCFLFHFTEKIPWRDAQEECERLGGFLAEPKSEEQATLLTSLAFVEEAAVGMHAWWIGLTDQGHERRWIWQHSVEDAAYTNWAPGYPRNTDPLYDCAVMDSRDNFEWSDVDCEDVMASPVCQRDTTTDWTTTTVRGPTTTSQYHVLLSGGNSSAGNVFALNSYGYFGPVCDDSWGSTAATVVCRQLGFNHGTALSLSPFGEVPDLFAMDEVHCHGSENYIQECSYDSNDNCGPGEGAGVVCY